MKIDKDIYYVGQAIRIIFRVNQHFTGRGNGDVYADYKYGDSFTIRLLPLSTSGYDSLDRFEKEMIDATGAILMDIIKHKITIRHWFSVFFAKNQFWVLAQKNQKDFKKSYQNTSYLS